MEVVECIASASYPGNPRAVYWDGVRFEIVCTIAQIRTPQQICFWVKAREGRVFKTCYEESTQQWTVEMQ